jgi:Protein of unknown function (DUF3617)
MNHGISRSLLIAFAFAVTGLCAQAQTKLPIKQGLWQTRIEREVNGQKPPDMSERMKNMSPEARAHAEAVMKEHGIDPGADGVRKMCYNQEMIEQGRLAEEQSNCKTNFSSRSTTSWKWHTSCPQLNYEGDGEAVFSDSENYVIKSSGVMTIAGKTRTSQSTTTSKWLSADCGDLKPLQLNP